MACRKAHGDHINGTDDESEAPLRPSPRNSTITEKPQIWIIFEGLKLILSSSYLLQVALFLWLNAVVSSFFYFQVRKHHPSVASVLCPCRIS